MGFKEAIDSVLKKNYANFQGRAARSEYWFFALFVFIVAGILSALMFATVDFNTGQISGLGYVIIAILAVFYLAILIPSIAVAVRRLHDRNMSGWWYLGFIVLSAIPFVGIVASIAMLVIFCLKGTDGDNRFGPDPLRPSARADIFA
ncbi:DUF805 domain-containing protein [Rhodobacter sp. SGA-6-6]|uniref:DUF805 domain-containing protein n=1 Tax=Rhodobacter sp. SGA-6-6 TaxID=2710882 RepID=UPI0013EDBBB8|nr:DUF805 domain-containing protein [Rhodobacter sp. SGA-6-6]NGM47185.1 DUF805 domain-containing protein [Rhodobacter sp. SGA-6-6]